MPTMRVFWYQGGVQIQPESPKEADLLVRCVPLNEPPGLRQSSPGGSTELGDQSILEFLIRDQKPGPRRVTIKPSD